mgnify:CR=1 FL=1
MPLIHVFLTAMLPIGELRASIPIAILRADLPWQEAFLVSVAGNMVPVLVLTPCLHRLASYLSSFQNPLGRLLAWRTQKLKSAHQKAFSRFGPLALVLLVAIPLPITGAWTGTLAAWVFQIPAKTAIPLIAIGVCIAGGIVTLLTLSGIHITLLITAE